MIEWRWAAGAVTLQAVDAVVSRLEAQGYAFETVSVFLERRRF